MTDYQNTDTGQVTRFHKPDLNFRRRRLCYGVSNRAIICTCSVLVLGWMMFCRTANGMENGAVVRLTPDPGSSPIQIKSTQSGVVGPAKPAAFSQTPANGAQLPLKSTSDLLVKEVGARKIPGSSSGTDVGIRSGSAKAKLNDGEKKRVDGKKGSVKDGNQASDTTPQGGIGEPNPEKATYNSITVKKPSIPDRPSFDANARQSYENASEGGYSFLQVIGIPAMLFGTLFFLMWGIISGKIQRLMF